MKKSKASHSTAPIAVNVVVNLALIPVWGVSGAALGAAANMIVWNALLAFRVHRKLGIRPTIVC